MKDLVTASLLGIFLTSACASSPRNRGVEPESVWPFGTYELVIFQAEALPVECPDGRQVTGGHLTLVGGTGPVAFELVFEYSGARRTDFRSGLVQLGEQPHDGSPIPLQFDAVVRSGPVDMDDVGPRSLGFNEPPLGWSDQTVAVGQVSGNELRIGEETRVLIFMRR